MFHIYVQRFDGMDEKILGRELNRALAQSVESLISESPVPDALARPRGATRRPGTHRRISHRAATVPCRCPCPWSPLAHGQPPASMPCLPPLHRPPGGATELWPSATAAD